MLFNRTSMMLAETISDTADQVTEDMEQVSSNVTDMIEWLKNKIPSIISCVLMIVLALIIFGIGRKIISILLKLFKKSFERSRMEEGVCRFLLSLINISLNVVLVVIIAAFLGIETTSLAALVGSAGLAVGLSLQGSLANLAGGVLILCLKPFSIGDYIVAEGVEGVVNHIDIFYTRLMTADNKMVVIPNGKLSNAVITNVTSEEERRADFKVGIAYGSDCEFVKKILVEIAENEPLALKEKPVDVFIDAFDSSSVTVGLRVWCKTADYWQVRWNIQESIKKTFDANGIEIPFEQLDIHVRND